LPEQVGSQQVPSLRQMDLGLSSQAQSAWQVLQFSVFWPSPVSQKPSPQTLGLTHCPPSHALPLLQSPHDPPQASAPHTAMEH
jgi:hypothetical protein